jgi:ankyrin repeat protein
MKRPSLVIAVQRGQKHEVVRLIRKKADVSEPDHDGFTPLMEAAANNHISILTLLLEAKADLHATNAIGRTCLIEAAARGHPAITLCLCQAKANLNFANERHPLHLTALHEAASRGHDGVVFWLCEARADINKPNAWGDTPLIMAAHNNRLEAVQALLAQRANLDIRGDAGQTALDVALSQGHARIAELLSDPRARDSASLNRLYARIKAAQKEVLQDEVNYDASVSSRKIPVPAPLPAEVVLARDDEMQEALAPLPPAPAVPLPPLLARPALGTPRLSRASVRRLPLAELPAFGSVQWIATEPRRTSCVARAAKVAHFDDVLAGREELFPVLTLRDSGEWSYLGDTLSGDLHGTFEVLSLLTVASLDAEREAAATAAAAAVAARSARAREKSERAAAAAAAALGSTESKEGTPVLGGWRSLSDGKSLGDKTASAGDKAIAAPAAGSAVASAAAAAAAAAAAEKASTLPLPSELGPAVAPYSYLVRLTTVPPLGPDGAPLFPQQIVGFVLGRQILLGKLVMELHEHAVPWWAFGEAPASPSAAAAPTPGGSPTATPVSRAVSRVSARASATFAGTAAASLTAAAGAL